MPTEGFYDVELEYCHARCRRRDKILKYWMDEDCTKHKAEKLHKMAMDKK